MVSWHSLEIFSLCNFSGRSPEAIFDRVKDSTERPLLNGNMRVDFIRDLMESRREKYEAAADICIDTTEKDIVEICEELLQKLSSL